MQDEPSDNDLYDSIIGADALNIKKTAALNDIEVLKSLCTRLSFASKVYIYGQGFCSAAAMYLYAYLKVILPNVCCVNLTGLEPLQSIAEIDSGDLLLTIGFPSTAGPPVAWLAMPTAVKPVFAPSAKVMTPRLPDRQRSAWFPSTVTTE